MTYEVHLQHFDGPLDLLLHLIEQAKVDIKDIFVSEITAQYLAYMEGVDTLDMDTASEFLNMAATLLYIKSRTLLPKPPKEDSEEEDPETVLLRQLRDYKAFKEAGSRLSVMQEDMKHIYSRLPEEFLLPPQEFDISDATTAELFNAFIELLKQSDPPDASPHPLHAVSADVFTVRNQLRHIRGLLSERNSLRFEELFEHVPAKMEKIVTFMALLDMIMRGEISLKQSKPYGAITLIAGQLLNEDDDALYMDEQ